MATPFPNQPPPFEGHDLFAIDGALQAAVARDAADGAALRLSEWGTTLGASSTYALADAANRNPPALRSYDRRGERIDEGLAPIAEPLATSQISAPFPLSTDAMRDPSGESATDAMGSECPPVKVWIAFPVVRSQSTTRLSPPPVTARFPSGDN